MPNLFDTSATFSRTNSNWAVSNVIVQKIQDNDCYNNIHLYLVTVKAAVSITNPCEKLQHRISKFINVKNLINFAEIFK